MNSTLTLNEIMDLNFERAKSMDQYDVAPRVMDLIRYMVNRGFRPLIHKDVYRKPERQLELFNSGMSKVKVGYHCVTNPDGTPASHAADIVDADKQWFEGDKQAAISDIDERFWLALGKGALDNGLDWGGLWFNGSAEERLRRKKFLVQHIESQNTEGLQTSLHFGWDVAHVEVRGLEIQEAYDGYRMVNGYKVKVF